MTIRDSGFGGRFGGRTNRAINNQISSVIRDNLPSGRAGQAFGALLNAVDPRILGGGTYQGDANLFAADFNERTAELLRDLDIAATPQVNSDRNGQLSKDYDWRARLRPKNGGKDRFYGAAPDSPSGPFDNDRLMRPIMDSNGLVWQNTPSFYMTGSANYSPHLGQGMQYQIHAYQNSQIGELTLTADFTANDIYEARYMLAMMTFMKIATKGDFGDPALSRDAAGAPPPVMVFEYLGDHGFNKVPVIVTNYNLTFQNDVDYVPVELGDTTTFVPTICNVIVTMAPQYSPRKVREQYDVEAIANGSAYTRGFI